MRAPDRQIELVVPNPDWHERFEAEKRRLGEILGESLVRIHHIGSTAIKGIVAKPIIDILVEADDLAQIDQKHERMQEIGYQPKGENGIPDRRFFQKEENGRHTFHVHVFLTDSHQVNRHLAFRDGMNGDPSFAMEYERVKSDAFRQAEGRSGKYQELKKAFIDAMTEKFLADGNGNFE